MKIIRNNIIPFKGFSAINLFGILFVRNDAMILNTTITHEQIHTKQMKELLYIFFYLWYFIEWIIRLCQYGLNKDAYYNISFEREAYYKQSDKYYLLSTNRPKYAFISYLNRP